jgi:DNA polymerase V
MMRVRGASMVPIVNDGDRVVVDKAIAPRHGDIVIAEINGGFTVKRLYQRNGFTSLIAENPDYEPIALEPGMTLEIWGVVTFVLHKTCTRL